MVAPIPLMPRRVMTYEKAPLAGVDINTALPPGTLKAPMLFEDSTTGDVFLLTVTDAIGTQVWEPWAGGGLAGLDYWVAPPSVPPLINPQTRFTTITAAIAQAVADQHTAANPAVIWVYPGTYAESFAMRDGISVRGLSAHASEDMVVGGKSGTTWDPDVIIAGQVTIGAGFTQGTIEGVVIVNSGAAAALALGASTTIARLIVRDCTLSTTGAATSAITGSPTTTPQLNFERCQVVNNTTQGAGVAALLSLTTACNVNSRQSSWQANAASDIAFNMNGGTWVMEGSKVFGQLSFTTGATNFTERDSDFAASGAYIAISAGGPTINLVKGSFTGSTVSPNVTGTGTLNLQGNIGSDVNGLQLATTITTAVNRTLAAGKTARDNGAGNLTAANCLLADLHTLDTSGAARSVALPARALVPAGKEFVFCAKVGGANAITVNPNGAETIAGVAAGVASTAAILGTVAVQADPNSTTNWNLISRS